MLRWMNGITLKERIKNDCICRTQKIAPIHEKMREGHYNGLDTSVDNQKQPLYQELKDNRSQGLGEVETFKDLN